MSASLDDVMAVVAAQLGVRPSGPQDRILEDLRAESLDVVAIAAAIEDRFGVYIDDTEFAGIRTVGDLHVRVLRGDG